MARYKILEQCEGFNILKSSLNDEELQEMEQVIDQYLYTSIDEQEETEVFPDAVNWYVGAITTEDFLSFY